MTIRALSNRQNNRPPIPKIGTIRKGAKTTNAKGIEYPTDLDYFLFDFEEECEWLTPHVKRLFGEKPIALDVYLIPVFPQDDPIESYAPHSMQSWVKSRLMVDCEGEGGYTTRVWDAQVQDYDKTAHPCQMTDGACSQGCKPRLRLRVVLPELTPIAGWGYFDFATGAWSDVGQIVSALQFALSFNLMLGGVQWRLIRQYQKQTYKDPKDGKQKSRDTYPVSLVFTGANGGLLGTGQAPALPMADVPMIASGNDSTHYDYDDEPFDEGIVVEHVPPPLKNADAPQKTGREMVMQALSEYGYADEGQVLKKLQFRNWDELIKSWHKVHKAFPSDATTEIKVQIVVNTFLATVQDNIF